VLQMVREVAELEGFLESVQEWEGFWPEPVGAPAVEQVQGVVVEDPAEGVVGQGSAPSNHTIPTSAGPPDSQPLIEPLPINTTSPPSTSQSASMDPAHIPHSTNNQHQVQPANHTGVCAWFQKLRCW
jgi:hypothetical protein